jgi:hypothetical protein
MIDVEELSSDMEIASGEGDISAGEEICYFT